MPNKESNRIQSTDTKSVMASTQQSSITKAATPVAKVVTCKTTAKDPAMSPTPPAAELERTELLGSLTTLQQQRTSARVIKKLRLEPAVDKDKKSKRPDGQPDDLNECETPNKIDDKDPLKFPTVKQRMPKALWSTDEKNLFFEALNEYGKDFDAITAYICAKMKKKGMPDVNLKTKTQVSHFYYRTWHKLSKHVRFDENVKKVAQELYALINYGELRKKLSCVSEKTCARLGEMVRCGSIAVRARGRNLRVRTPACRALRNLNQITERVYSSRVCGRACCVLRARDAAAWGRVQAASHNPRALVAVPLRTRLRAFVQALAQRWTPPSYFKPESTTTDKYFEEPTKETEDVVDSDRPQAAFELKDDDEHLHLETDRMILQEQKLPKKPVLHVGPKPSAEIHLPVVNPSEQLSSQKICFSSYLERMCSQRRDKDGNSKIRTPKRQRKDSTTEKDREVEQKKFKPDDNDVNKLMHIDETAIDGIELMANYKNILEDEEKPSTEDEKELKSEETADEAETVPDKDVETVPEKDLEREKDITERDMLEREKDSFSELEDDEKYAKSDTDNESDQGKSDKTGKTKFKNLKVKFRIRPKKRGGSIYTLVLEKGQDQESKPDEPKMEGEPKPDIDVEMAVRQIRKGWSEYDAGDLMIGDLYLMFGSRSKLELDYWWAVPTPPLPQPQKSKPDTTEKEKHTERKEKTDKTDGSVEESDTDIFSPKHPFSHDSNDALSGDERKGEQLASPEHKSSGGSSSFKLVSKLVNRPQPSPTAAQAGMSLVGERLKRLLSLAGNPHAAAPARCGCGNACPHRRPQQRQQPHGPSPATLRPDEPAAPVFRHPTPIAPRPDAELQKTLNLAGVPRWRRGRPRLADRRVVVQRLLPLLPKLPPPNNLIPVKIVPNSPPAPPRILPKPPPTSTSDLSFFYVLSESNGQFYFHDGDRRIPITPMSSIEASPQDDANDIDDDKPEMSDKMDHTDASDGVESGPNNGVCHLDQSDAKDSEGKKPESTLSNGDKKPDNADIGNFLPTESMSLSPSRLLRETEGWFESSVQDFSLSSFLGHLEGRVQPELAVDSQLQSLMAESSVDYVAKFADLAAEVTDEVNQINEDLT